MDTFFEQLIAIRKNGAQIAAIIGIWVLGIAIAAFFLLFNIPFLSTFAPIIVAGALFGAYKLTTLFNIEYEYIVTNGVLDVDKIVNKSSRKRYLSLNLSKTSRLEKYNASLLTNVNKKNITVACNLEDPNAYLLVVDRDNRGADYLVMSPNDKMKGAIAKSVPKFISNSAFK